MLDKATLVSETLSRRLDKQKRKSKSFHLSRRRNLVLKLKETLIQARDGNMDDKMLQSWLTKVQDEFVTRMSRLSEDLADEESEMDGNEKEGDEEHDYGSESESQGSVNGLSNCLDLDPGQNRGDDMDSGSETNDGKGVEGGDDDTVLEED